MPDEPYRRLRPLLLSFPTYYRFRHKISDASPEKDRASVAAALDGIERRRQAANFNETAMSWFVFVCAPVH